MNVQKFYASTTRDALRKVRDALGPDAIILGNRQVVGGIEIMAVADMDMTSLTGIPEKPSPARFRASEPPPPPAKQWANSAPENPPPARSRPVPYEFPMHDAPPPVASVAAPRTQKDSFQEKARPAPVENRASPEPITQDIIREIKFLRGMLEAQLSGFAWGDMHRKEPTKIEALRHLLSVGISPLLSRQLLEKMPAGYDLEKSLRWLKAALTHNLNVVKERDDIVDRGGVYALIGPTGIGKTTTVAKLAARCTLKHGSSSLALITTDTYRIGAHEQLRIYGKILGVPVYVIKDEADLQLTLSDLLGKHMILIDTVGMSQRDRRLTEQVALLSGGGRRIKRLLLLSANGQGSTLDDVVRSHKTEDLDGCILTKIDEAISLGPVLDVVIRHKLTLHYVANGQRVPEDLHLPNAAYLVDRALKPAAEISPFALRDAEYPLAMAAVESSSDFTEAKRDLGALRG